MEKPRLSGRLHIREFDVAKKIAESRAEAMRKRFS